MEKRVDYRKIRTLADVQAQRLRIARELDRVEMRLEEDYRRIDDMFSVNYLIERVANGIGKFYSIFEWIRTIYTTIRVTMDKYRKGHETTPNQKDDSTVDDEDE